MQHDPLVLLLLFIIVFYVSTMNDKEPETVGGFIFWLGYRLVMGFCIIDAFIQVMKS